MPLSGIIAIWKYYLNGNLVCFTSGSVNGVFNV